MLTAPATTQETIIKHYELTEPTIVQKPIKIQYEAPSLTQEAKHLLEHSATNLELCLKNCFEVLEAQIGMQQSYEISHTQYSKETIDHIQERISEQYERKCRNSHLSILVHNAKKHIKILNSIHHDISALRPQTADFVLARYVYGLKDLYEKFQSDIFDEIDSDEIYNAKTHYIKLKTATDTFIKERKLNLKLAYLSHVLFMKNHQLPILRPIEDVINDWQAQINDIAERHTPGSSTRVILHPIAVIPMHHEQITGKVTQTYSL